MQKSKIKNQNYSSKFKNPQEVRFQSFLFYFFHFSPRGRRRGVTLLLVILVISAVLAVSIGIFSLVFSEIRISGEIADSFVALYAADQGVEKLLWLDRVDDWASVSGSPCSGTGACAWSDEENHPYVSGACIRMRYDRDASGNARAIGGGEYRCGIDPLTVIRAVEVSYNKSGALPQPVNRWAMNEAGNGTCPGGRDVCDSVGSRHGAVGSVNIVAGVSGNARRVTAAADVITVADHPSLDSALTGSYTVVVWANSSSASAVRRMIGKGGGLFTVIFNHPAVGKVLYYTGTVLDANALPSVISNLNNGQWRQLAFVRDGTTQKIYVDGVLDNSRAEVTAPSANGTDFNIGSDGTGFGSFDGALDQAEIYDSALAESQICGIYKAVRGRPACP